MKIIANYSDIYNMPFVTISGIYWFDIEKTFECGQCFRFNKIDFDNKKAYEGIAFNKYIIFTQENEDSFTIYNSTKEDFETIWSKFLCFDDDYEKINEVISNAFKKGSNEYLHMNAAINASSGIRIIKQDTFETLISFIISQNNNIPRIKKIINALSEKCGDKIETPFGTKYAFPTAKQILSIGLSGLNDLKTGFRAKYIYDAATKWNDGIVSEAQIISAKTYEEADDILSSISGVGPKVAACTLLFGYHRIEAFPIDVWVKRVIANHFSCGLDPKVFGNYAGIAQQYLFFYERILSGVQN